MLSRRSRWSKRSSKAAVKQLFVVRSVVLRWLSEVMINQEELINGKRKIRTY